MSDAAIEGAPRRRRVLVWAGAAVVIVAAVVAASLWWLRDSHTASPKDDCGIVAQLGPQWIAMNQVEKDTERGPGETKDLLALASAESDIGDKIRTAQAAVTNPELKTQLGDWAQGMALTAKGQREAADPSTSPVPAPPAVGTDSEDVRAAMLVHNSTAALQKTCPQLQLSPSPQR